MNQNVFDPKKFSDCLNYVETYWEKIIRHTPKDEGTLIGLPHRYVVPNHQMFKEQYYWDSFFIALGLTNTKHRCVIREMTDNLLYLAERFGRIPNASRFYFLSRSQPPLLTSMIRLSYQICSECPDCLLDKKWLQRAYKHSKNLYETVWRGTEFPDQREMLPHLSRYYDLNIHHSAAECESGWDMTPRFENRCMDFLPIDLNCLLFKYERDLEEISSLIGTGDEEHWQELQTSRKAAIDKYLWDPELSYFCDYDLKQKKRRPFKSAAVFFALWSELASKEQAELIVKNLLPELEYDYGIVTTEEVKLEDPSDYKQWAHPNGWAPLHWAAVSGLIKYGYQKEANRIAEKWVTVVDKVFREHGENFEKYDVVSGDRALRGRYEDQSGFAWTNAIFSSFCELLENGPVGLIWKY